MTLRKALIELPDDRESVAAARDVIAYFDRHKTEIVDPQRIGAAIGMASWRVAPVLTALANARVIDCDGDPLTELCSYRPDTVLDLEVRHFLKGSGGIDSGLQRRVEKFRGTYGR